MTQRNLLIVIALAVLGILLIGGAAAYIATMPKQAAQPEPSTILSFEDCLAGGYPVTTNERRQCTLPDGRVFAEETFMVPTYVNASADLIRVDNPTPGAVTGKTFSVMGEARGTWFFEASFPIELLDKNGKLLTTGIAQARGDWMTENFVPFKADITVPESYIGPVILVLKKDNPSGLPENDASMYFPITVEF